MLLTLISAACFIQTPKTFEELEIAKIKQYRELKRYEEQLKVRMGDTVINQTSFVDNRRFQVKLGLSTGQKYDTFCDGQVSVNVNHADKSYSQGKVEQPEVFDPKSALLKPGDQVFNLMWGSGLPVRFAVDAALELKFEEDKEGSEKLRKVVATATGPNGGKLVLTQWFKAEKWILVKFTVKMPTDEESPYVQGEVKTLDLKSVKDSDFKWDPKTSPDYKLKG